MLVPTPRGGLLPPTNGANSTLATGWIRPVRIAQFCRAE